MNEGQKRKESETSMYSRNTVRASSIAE